MHRELDVCGELRWQQVHVKKLLAFIRLGRPLFLGGGFILYGLGALIAAVHGHAIDIRVPGVTTVQLRNAALSVGGGGVGYYPVSQFVHVDVGPVRTWTFGRTVRTAHKSTRRHRAGRTSIGM